MLLLFSSAEFQFFKVQNHCMHSKPIGTGMEKEISKFPGLLASQLTNGMSLKLNISRK
jgi:hypothetical protein